MENHNKVYLWSDPDLVILFFIPDTGNPFLSKENNIANFSRSNPAPVYFYGQIRVILLYRKKKMLCLNEVGSRSFFC